MVLETNRPTAVPIMEPFGFPVAGSQPEEEPGRPGGSPSSGHQATRVAVRVTVSRPRWQHRYARIVAATDLAAVLVSAASYRFWGSPPPLHDGRTLMGVAVAVAALPSLHANRAWDPRVLGQGPEEFNRLLRAFLWLGVLTGLLGLALRQSSLRPYAFGVIPLAFVISAVARLLCRGWVRRLRRRGRCMRNVLAVGSEQTVARVIERARRAECSGWAVTGACLSSGASTVAAVHGVPVIGDPEQVADKVLRFGYHVVCVAPGTGWSSQTLHQLTWDLEGTGTEIVVDPGLMEIAGPRLALHAVDGVPMLRLEEPAFRGLPRLVKAMTDFLGAALLLLLLSPVLLVTAVCVRCSGGPVFYRQQRIGRNGTPFMMIKFRSMVCGADRMQAAIQARNVGAGPMFKVHGDPRVTRIGRPLRRHSIDELPQLWNVLTGSMSLVGPRPPLPLEALALDRAAQRKLLVRPGMTGLWQVSGRSDLSWEESVRLDLSYVENWSLLTDVMILLRTFAAVTRSSGAY